MKRYKPLMESKIDISTINLNKISSVFYHGSVIESYFKQIHNLETSKSEYKALWFTDNEEISKLFLKEKRYPNDEYIPIIYKVKLACKKTAHITDDIYLKIAKLHPSDSGIKEYIPQLKREGFDSWIGTGRWNNKNYNDIAVFKNDNIHIVGVSLKIKNKWTPYMTLNIADEFLDNLN